MRFLLESAGPASSALASPGWPSCDFQKSVYWQYFTALCWRSPKPAPTFRVNPFQGVQAGVMVCMMNSRPPHFHSVQHLSIGSGDFPLQARGAGWRVLVHKPPRLQSLPSNVVFRKDILGNSAQSVGFLRLFLTLSCSWHRSLIYSALLSVTAINNPPTPKESQALLNKLYQVWYMCICT